MNELEQARAWVAQCRRRVREARDAKYLSPYNRQLQQRYESALEALEAAEVEEIRLERAAVGAAA